MVWLNIDQARPVLIHLFILCGTLTDFSVIAPFRAFNFTSISSVTKTAPSNNDRFPSRRIKELTCER